MSDSETIRKGGKSVSRFARKLVKTYKEYLGPDLIAVLLFAPTILIGRGLKKKVETESITEGLNRIKNLRGKAVSEDLLKIKKDQLQIHANDANEIKRLAVQTTQREFLIDDIFDVNDPNS